MLKVTMELLFPEKTSVRYQIPTSSKVQTSKRASQLFKTNELLVIVATAKVR